jgi:hypothetical protein
MRVRFPLLATSLAGLALFACECDPALNTIPTPEAVLSYGDARTPDDGPYVEVGFAPSLIGEPVSVELTLENVGGVVLDVSQVRIAADSELCPTASASFSVTDPGPFSVESGASRALPVVFTPASGQPVCAVVEVASNDETHPVLKAVFRGQGDAPQLCASPQQVDFGVVHLGDTADDVVTLESCGTRPITLTGATTNEHFPPFDATLPAAGTVLAPGDTLEVAVSFAPTQERTYSLATGTAGLISFATNDENAGYQIALVGEGRRAPACRMMAVPQQLQFGTVAESRTSAQNVVIRNAGELACTFDSADVRAPAGSFSAALTGGAMAGMQLEPNDTIVVEVTFAPATAAGVENAFLDVASSDPINPLIEVPLEGNSIEPTPCFLEASPTAVNFGNQAVGRTVDVTVSVENVGTETCSIRETEMLNGAPHFGVVASALPLIGTVVPVGGTSEFQVTYRPATEDAHVGTVQLTYKELGFGNPDLTLQVPLTGNGLAPRVCVQPTSIDFGTVAEGSSADENLAVVNCGAVDLSYRGVQLRAGGHPDFALDDVPALPINLAPGAQSVLTVRAKPTPEGTLAGGSAMYGTVEVLTDDTAVPTYPVPLRANAPLCVDGLVCSPHEVDFGTVDVDESLVRAVTCQNPGTTTVQTSPSITGPFQLVNGPSEVPPMGTGVFTVRYGPSAAGLDTGELLTGATSCDGTPMVIDLVGEGVDDELPVCPTPQAFTPQVVWHWDGGGVLPKSNQSWGTPLISRLEDTTGDGRVTRDDMPRVVFISFDHEESPGITDAAQNQDHFNDPTPGVLRALDGETGAEIFTVTDPAHRLNSSVTPVLADIDADGFVEIIGQRYVVLEGIADIPEGPKVKGKFVRGNLLAFEHDGTFKWISDEWTRSQDEIEDAGGLAVGDIDGDGFAEIAVGDNVFDHNGRLMWKGGAGSGSTGHGPSSFFADVDGQPGLELVAGRTVYRNNGAILWDRSDLGGAFGVEFDGHPAVGDLDGDGDNEVVVRSGQLYVFDGATGATIAGPKHPPTSPGMGDECESGMAGGEEGGDDPCNIIPTNVAIMDTDGNGTSEIVVSAQELILVYDHQLNELWRATVGDYTGASGPMGFDFENDGKVNVVYSDESHVWVYDDVGNTIYDASRASVTMMETAAIGDINLDGHANMVVGSNEPNLGISDGLDMLSNSGTSWAQARAMWNQHAYVESLVGELGTPVFESGGMAPLAGFRTATPACVLP